MSGVICPKCGADKLAYLETMGEPCCPDVDSPVYVEQVVRQFFRKDELTTPELEKLIKGSG